MNSNNLIVFGFFLNISMILKMKHFPLETKKVMLNIENLISINFFKKSLFSTHKVTH